MIFILITNRKNTHIQADVLKVQQSLKIQVTFLKLCFIYFNFKSNIFLHLVTVLRNIYSLATVFIQLYDKSKMEKATNTYKKYV